MQQSTVYKELQAMIEKDWLAKSLSELDELLKQLMKGGRITRTDYRSLLELYLGKFNQAQ